MIELNPLHDSFTLGELCALLAKAQGLDSLVCEIMDEETGVWQIAPGDMTLGEFRHYTANEIGRVVGSMPGGGVVLELA